MARFVALDARSLQRIADAFDLGVVRRVTAIAAGTLNSNFRVDASHGCWAVRVNGGKTACDIAAEMKLVAALADGGVPTPAPVRTPDGQLCAMIDERWVCVFPWIDGVHRTSRDVTAKDAHAVGRCLASLHDVGLRRADDFDRVGIVNDVELEERLAKLHRQTDPAITSVLDMLDDERRWLWQQRPMRALLPRGVIHGDLFRDNVLFRGDDVVALLDFEQACRGPLAFDVGVCATAWCYGDRFEPARMSALVAGYAAAGQAIDPRALYVETRAAAWRFAITRITDVYLRRLDLPDKDFRRYTARLDELRRMGADRFAEMTR